MERLSFTLNGKKISADVDPDMRLADFLRDQLCLTGTKIGCGKGECGGGAGYLLEGEIFPVVPGRVDPLVERELAGAAVLGDLIAGREAVINVRAEGVGFHLVYAVHVGDGVAESVGDRNSLYGIPVGVRDCSVDIVALHDAGPVYGPVRILRFIVTGLGKDVLL